MNAFVAGKIDEVRTLATNLLKAVDIVESAEFDVGPETEIKYKDGDIFISYPMKDK